RQLDRAVRERGVGDRGAETEGDPEQRLVPQRMFAPRRPRARLRRATVGAEAPRPRARAPRTHGLAHIHSRSLRDGHRPAIVPLPFAALRTPVAAVVAVALAFPALATANDFQDVYRDYKRTGTIKPCRFSDKQLANAEKQTP